MREFFTIAIFKIKADIRMNKTTLNSQKEKHSTLSLRRATSLGLLSLKPHTHFYPRSPCGERPKWQVLDVQPKDENTLGIPREVFNAVAVAIDRPLSQQ